MFSHETFFSHYDDDHPSSRANPLKLSTVSSSSDEFDPEDTDINQYLSKKYVGVITKITKIRENRAQSHRLSTRFRFYVSANVVKKDGSELSKKRRSGMFGVKGTSIREVVNAAEKYFETKYVLKKPESISGTTSLNSPSAPPIFTNDSLRYMGKVESLKHKLTEKEEVVRNLTGELERTRKKLKSANISKAMTSKRRASRSSTMKDSEERNFRRHSADVQKFVQNLAGNNKDYIARILSNVSERCSSNGKFTTIDTDTYNAMKEQSSVMLRIKSTVNYLLLNKNISHYRTALQVLFAAAAPSEDERLCAETARVMGDVHKGSTLLKNGITMKKEFMAATQSLGTSRSDLSIGDHVRTVSGNGVVKNVSDKSVVIRVDLGRGSAYDVTFPIPTENDDPQSRKFGRIRPLIPSLWSERAARSDMISEETVEKVCYRCAGSLE